MLSLLLVVPSCIYSFWHGVIPTSYFIFNDFYTCFTNFFILALTRGEMPYVVRVLRYVRACVLCRKLWRVCTFLSTIKWRRSKRKSPRWTWILLSEGQTLPYYAKGTSRKKIRPSHIKIMVFRPFIWAVECLYWRRRRRRRWRKSRFGRFPYIPLAMVSSYFMGVFR